MNAAKSVVRYICGYVLGYNKHPDRGVLIDLVEASGAMDAAFNFTDWTLWIEDYFDFMSNNPDWSDVFITTSSRVALHPDLSF